MLLECCAHSSCRRLARSGSTKGNRKRHIMLLCPLGREAQSVPSQRGCAHQANIVQSMLRLRTKRNHRSDAIARPYTCECSSEHHDGRSHSRSILRDRSWTPRSDEVMGRLREESDSNDRRSVAGAQPRGTKREPPACDPAHRKPSFSVGLVAHDGRSLLMAGKLADRRASRTAREMEPASKGLALPTMCRTHMCGWLGTILCLSESNTMARVQVEDNTSTTHQYGQGPKTKETTTTTTIIAHTGADTDNDNNSGSNNNDNNNATSTT